MRRIAFSQIVSRIDDVLILGAIHTLSSFNAAACPIAE